MSVNKNLDIVFKAGNLSEVAQSLANYCQVPIEEINEANLQGIYEDYCNHPYVGISNALWSKFHGNKPRIMPSQYRVYHYHKTSSNGEKEWFKKGLLNKGLGIKEFISNLNIFYKIDPSNFGKNIINTNDLKHGIIGANDGPEYGPYSYVSMEYAVNNSNYNIPEILGNDNKIITEIKNQLKPTVVVFWFDYPINILDRHLKVYCGILLGYDMVDWSFEPKQIVPLENIENVICV